MLFSFNKLLSSDFCWFDSAEYAERPFIPPYLQPGNDQFSYGASLASAGAGALDETYQGLVCHLLKRD